MGIPYPLPRKRNVYEEKIRQLEERNKKLEEELKLLKAKLEQPIIVQPIQKVENVGNPRIIVIPSVVEEVSKSVGIRGIIESSKSEEVKEDPFWSLLKPGIFFSYFTFDIDGLKICSSDTYTILDIKRDIAEFRVDTYDFKEKKYYEPIYLYIDKNRRYWANWDHKKFGVAAYWRHSFESLEPTDEVTYLWINVRNLSMGDLVPLRFGLYKVVSIENGIYHLHKTPFDDYYDGKTGLFLRSENSYTHKTLRELVSTNLPKI